MVTDLYCTVAHCPCEIDLHGKSPVMYVTSRGEAVCSCHEPVVADLLGVVPFTCPIPQQRAGGAA
jgi:hypothetical protein